MGWGWGYIVVSAIILLFSVVTLSFVKKQTISYKAIQKELSLALRASSEAKGIKKQILERYIQCLEISLKISEIESVLAKLRRKIKKSKVKEHIHILEKRLEKLNMDLENSKYLAEEGLNQEKLKSYENLCKTFEKMMESNKMWEETSSASVLTAKSPMVRTVDRKAIKMNVGVFDYIKSDYDIPMIIFNSGLNLYLYPNFIITAESTTEFEIYSWDQIMCEDGYCEFVESFIPPTDSKKIRTTYKYVNKDGGPDRRYSNNPTYPVMEYRNLIFSILPIYKSLPTLIISNVDFTIAFSNAYREYNLSLGSKGGDRVSGTENLLSSTNIDNDDQGKFNISYDVANRLYDFIKVLSSKDDFQEYYNNLGDSDVKVDSEVTETSDAIKALGYGDALRCYLKLGKSPKVFDSEGQALFILCLKLFDLSIGTPLNYETYPSYKEKFNKGFIKANNLGKDYPDYFTLEYILKDYDKILHDKYVVLLYRFASIIAKIDGRIDKKESEWLSEIMKLQGDTDESTVQSNKDNEETDPYGELESLIGLASVKSEISSLANYVRIQQMRTKKGLKTTPISYHCVFTGNPGTGKTTVARIVSEIYKDLGVLKKGHLVETDRSGLVAEYVGQTAVKTNKIIDSALDGVLFIDEAYSLIENDASGFGREAISTLLKRMEDDRERLVVIIAGYTKEMKEFIDSNPGLRSRFNRYIEFPDYSKEELVAIFKRNAEKYEYTLNDDAEQELNRVIGDAVSNKDQNFGNGRYVRNLFERVIENQANRLSPISKISPEDIIQITAQDISSSTL